MASQMSLAKSPVRNDDVVNDRDGGSALAGVLAEVANGRSMLDRSIP